MNLSSLLMRVLIACTLLVSAPQTTRADNDGEVSFDLFYQALEPLGHWIQIDGYGYAWQPYSAAEDPNWRPYTIGSWCSTDAGWTWMSEEEFGWAVYHYGRWVKLDDIGWAWIPGYEWAPAWVAWRRSMDDEYLGWAPLPPEAQYEPTIGFSSWVDDYYDIGPVCYNFVNVRNFCVPRLRTYVLPYERNAVIFQQSFNITNICHRPTVLNQIFVGGPELAFLEQHCLTPVRRYTLLADDGRALDLFRRNPRAGCHELFKHRGNNVIVAAPHFGVHNLAQIIAPTAIKHHVDTTVVDHGWKSNSAMQLQAQLHQTMQNDAHRNPAPILPPKVMHAMPISNPSAITHSGIGPRPNANSQVNVLPPTQPLKIVSSPPTPQKPSFTPKPGSHYQSDLDAGSRAAAQQAEMQRELAHQQSLVAKQQREAQAIANQARAAQDAARMEFSNRASTQITIGGTNRGQIPQSQPQFQQPRPQVQQQPQFQQPRPQIQQQPQFQQPRPQVQQQPQFQQPRPQIQQQPQFQQPRPQVQQQPQFQQPRPQVQQQPQFQQPRPQIQQQRPSAPTVQAPQSQPQQKINGGRRDDDDKHKKH